MKTLYKGLSSQLGKKYARLWLAFMVSTTVVGVVSVVDFVLRGSGKALLLGPAYVLAILAFALLAFAWITMIILFARKAQLQSEQKQKDDQKRETELEQLVDEAVARALAEQRPPTE